MVFERTEHEPEEPDPEADLHDPETDSLTIPRVEPPAVDSRDGPGAGLADADVPADVAKTFWIVVIAVNAALLAVSLGAMLAVFRGNLATGAGLVAGGVTLFGLAYRRYRAFRRSDDGSGPRNARGDDAESTPDRATDTDANP